MCRRLVLLMTLALLIGTLYMAPRVQKVKAGGTVYIRADGSIYPSDAPISNFGNVTYILIGNISDSIIVERDNIVIDGAGCTVQGKGIGLDIGIDLSYRTNVTVKNMKIKKFYNGIQLHFSTNSTIMENTIMENIKQGISLIDSSNTTIAENNVTENEQYGIFLEKSSWNRVSKNNVTNNIGGVWFMTSPNNNLTGNNIMVNILYGVRMHYSSNNILRDNAIIGNKYNFGVGGVGLSDFINNIDTSNMVEGKPLFYMVNEKNLVINPETYPNIGYLAVINSQNITMQHLKMEKNVHGILLSYTKNSLVENVTLIGNWFGIEVHFSSYNNITKNNITCNYNGIKSFYSTNNSIYQNNFLNNIEKQVISDSSANVWDNGVEGNFWSDYNGSDLNQDGIIDVPRIMDKSNQDHYPLMGMFNSFNVQRTISQQLACEIDTWNVSAVLEKGDLILVGIMPGVNWIQPPFDYSGIPGIGFLYCCVNISDPSGKATWFVLTWASNPQQPFLSMWNITVEAKSDGLDTSIFYRPQSSIPYLAIGGKVTKSGQYDVKVYGVYPPIQEGRDPPSMLDIRKSVTRYYQVNVISNSTIEGFTFFESNSTIKMRVSNMTVNQNFGFCRIRIPHALIIDPCNVTIDGVEPYYANYTLYDDLDSRWIYFTYKHSTLEIIIVPEFSHTLIQHLFTATALLAIILFRKKLK